MTRHVLVGNLRVGDALWMGRSCTPDAENVVWCVPYNAPAIAALRYLTRLPIDRVEVIQDRAAGVPIATEADYSAWCARFGPRDAVEVERYRWTRRPGGQFGDCRPYPLRNERRPRGFIAAQLDSAIAPEKRWGPLVEALTAAPLPVRTIAMPGGLLVGEPSDALVGRSLVEVGGALLEAELYVGIASSITCLAMLLGVPTIVCWWVPAVGEWHTVPEHVTQLFRPSVEDIRAAIARRLEEAAAA